MCLPILLLHLPKELSFRSFFLFLSIHPLVHNLVLILGGFLRPQVLIGGRDALTQKHLKDGVHRELHVFELLVKPIAQDFLLA